MPIYVARFFCGEFTNECPRALETIEGRDFQQALREAARRTAKGDVRVVVEEFSKAPAKHKTRRASPDKSA